MPVTSIETDVTVGQVKLPLLNVENLEAKNNSKIIYEPVIDEVDDS